MRDLDPVIHAPARLRIMTTLTELLAEGDEIAYTRLRRHLELTPGNLTTHLARLEDAGYVETTKTFHGRKPATAIALTPAGRQAYAAYRAALLELLRPAD